MIQFDNVHLRRDNPNVPSDLEQMPNLLSFLESQGSLLTNHHTPLISHTAHPAPWVPFTRAGCDVGAFSTANIEFENVSGDINNVFGPNSFEAMEASSNFNKAVADFEGIAIHCARSSTVCGTAGAPMSPEATRASALGPADVPEDDSPTVMLPAGMILDSRIRDDSDAPEEASPAS